MYRSPFRRLFRAHGSTATTTLVARLRVLVALLVGVTLAVPAVVIPSATPAVAASRIFTLNVQNDLAAPVSFTIQGVYCWEGTPRSGVLGPVPSGGQVSMEIARVQGHGCDGENGAFTLAPAINGIPVAGERQLFAFSNDGGLWMKNLPNAYSGYLSVKNPIDESYTWRIAEPGVRLSAPPDERLTHPRNPTAYDQGVWSGLSQTTQIDTFEFRNQPELGLWGTHYESCWGEPLFHTQNVLRLANKNGRAYFIVTASRGHNGMLYLMETDAGAVDPQTDLLKPGVTGRIIWQDNYTGSFNGRVNPVGNWNHPGKMALQGGVLIIAAQNWSEAQPTVDTGCTHSTSNPFLMGDSEDSLLFYDVRDPQNPEYWGEMTASELQLRPFTQCNGWADRSSRRQISVVDLTRDPETDEYRLNVGISKGGGVAGFGACAYDDYSSYRTWRPKGPITPNISDWDLIGGQDKYVDFPNAVTETFGIGSGYVSGEHGNSFNSYQLLNGEPAGTERIVAFEVGDQDGCGNEAAIFGNCIPLPNPDRNWVSEAMYVTKFGEPVLYTVESNGQPEGDRDDDSAYLIQVHDTANSPANQPANPIVSIVTNTNDSGVGSLRRAIGYGGTVSFAPSLNGQTITLLSGPLVVYQADVTIDASSLSDGVTIDAGNASRVFQVESGYSAKLDSLTLTGGRARVVSHGAYGPMSGHPRGSTSTTAFGTGTGGSILNRGDLTIVNSTITGNAATLQGGGIMSLHGSVVLENTTVTGNQSDVTFGGGLVNYGPSSMSLMHSTIASNSSNIAPAGIFNGRAAALTLRNSIVADNAPAGGVGDLGGNYTAFDTNVVESIAFGERLGGAAPLTEDPSLLPLADNGGPSETMALSERSVAIDVAGPSAVDRDQRGQPRPVGVAPDLGAVEKLFTGASPYLGQDNLNLTDVTLTWSDVPDATYEVFFDNGTGVFGPPEPTNTPTFAIPGTLDAETTYQWRVDVNSRGHTATGETLDFFTRGPLVVTTLVDENDPAFGQGEGNSLRENIAAAVPGNTIVFDPSLSGQTMFLGGSSLVIDKDLTIDASGADPITIDAGGLSRVFTIQSGHDVTLEKLTVSGGGATAGGGIQNDGSTVTLLDTTVTGNWSPDNGGGVHNSGGGVLVIRDSSVTDNTAANNGGGLYHDGTGGGSLTVDRSAAIGNGATSGGGVFVSNGTSVIENVTLAGNSSTADLGGATHSEGASASLTLRHVTAVGNVGGGLSNQGAAALILENSVVADNVDTVNRADDVRGDFTAVGANLVHSHDGVVLAGATPLDVEPRLEALLEYGGSGRSMAPRAGSPVINAAVVTADSPGFDQRGGGYPRPNGPLPDLGAIESDFSADATLKKLAASAGQLGTAFLPDILEYRVETANGTATTAVRLSTRASNEKVELFVNDPSESDPIVLPNVGDRYSPDVPLQLGENTLLIRVTAQDLVTTLDYTLTVFRNPVNSRLANLTTSAEQLTPEFDSETFDYTAYATSPTRTIIVTPTAADGQSTITVRGDLDAYRHPVTSGDSSPPLPIFLGCNFVYTDVLGSDGQAMSSYEMQVTRASTAPPADPPEVLTHDLLIPSSTTNDGWFDPVMTPDGRFIVFSSTATNLDPRDTNSRRDVYIYDSLDGSTELVSVNDSGGVGDKESGRLRSSISADGRYVAFDSEATNLVPGDTNGDISQSAGQDVFVFDRQTKTIERASLTDTGAQANGQSNRPSLSGDGRYLAFTSAANNLVTDFSVGGANTIVYVHDRVAGTIVGIAVPFDLPANRDSLNAVFSQDGSTVAFEFHVSKSVGSEPAYQHTDIWVYDRESRVVERITGFNSGPDADGNESARPSISADGRFIAFESNLEHLDFYDTNRDRDVYVHDRTSGVTERVSLDGDGLEGNEESRNPVISGNGQFVAFESRVATWFPGDPNGQEDIFLKNLVTGELRLLSQSALGAHGDNASFEPSISFDGSLVAFRSRSTNLGLPDNNRVYVAETGGLPARSPADLAALAISDGALSPCVRPEVTDYSAKVANGVDALRVRPIAAQPGATVEAQVNGGGFSPVVRNAPSEELSLDEGANTIDVRVISADGSTVKDYQITVDRSLPAAIAVEVSTNGVAPDADEVLEVVVGEPLTWRYKVTNTGQVELTEVEVTDDQGVAVACPGGNPIASLAVGATTTCTATGTASLGEYENAGTAAGLDDNFDSVTASALSNHVGVAAVPSVELTQATNGEAAGSAPGPELKVGDPVTWTYTVTNTGNVDITDALVSDDQGVTVTCPSGNPIPLLAIGASETCQATGVATAGQYQNTGSVIGTANGGSVGQSVPTAEASSQNATFDVDQSFYRVPTVPGAPRDVTAVAGDGEAAVSWIEPASDGGSEITGFSVVSSPGAFTCTTAGDNADIDVATGQFTCVVTGLANDTAYTFTVVATNEVGDGPPSAPTEPVVPEPVGDDADPVITLTTPANGATYSVAETVLAVYSCVDSGGSGLVSCEGTVANGAAIDTAAAGVKTFTVTAKDGAGNTATVTHEYVVTGLLCDGLVPTIIGDENDNVLLGTADDDVIWGGGGNDELRGNGGNDTICAGDGDDTVIGGAGDDTMFGESGSDLIKGLRGNDTADGGPGDDRIQGNAGDDVLDGGDGKDKMWGGIGADSLTGGSGNDQLHGNPGDDTLSGEDGTDRIWGDANDDEAIGGANSDFLYGGIGVDVLRGGDGRDRLFGGNGDDSLFGDGDRDQLRGQGGDDAVDGGAGSDFCSVETVWLNCEVPI